MVSVLIFVQLVNDDEAKRQILHETARALGFSCDLITIGMLDGSPQFPARRPQSSQPAASGHLHEFR